ncbi:MAG: thioesterase domain-containing protein, partial [Actinomycetota bacterium]|nr:thioesterase domain-containing protein [Actinomycetota bacterium]
PVLGLRAPDDEPDGTTLEQLAAFHVAALREVRPAGPYLLAGWSTGGLLAVEIARQLRTLGEEVPAVALFDTHLPPGDRPAMADRDDLPVLMRFAAEVARQLGASATGAFADFIGRPAAEQRAVVVEAMVRGGLLPHQGRDDGFDRLLRVFTRNSVAVDGYRMRRGDQRTVLFRAAEAGPAQELAQQWRPWTGELDVHVVPGDHHSMLRSPGVTTLAGLLRAELDRMDRPVHDGQVDTGGVTNV